MCPYFARRYRAYAQDCERADAKQQRSNSRRAVLLVIKISIPYYIDISVPTVLIATEPLHVADARGVDGSNIQRRVRMYCVPSCHLN
jgi:hypothetical protein